MQKEKVYSILLNSSRQDNKQYCKWNTAVNAKKVIASHGGGKDDKNIFFMNYTIDCYTTRTHNYFNHVYDAFHMVNTFTQAKLQFILEGFEPWNHCLTAC